ncbi:hypothetical protein HON71_00605 [Candidatus Woesearchaeota archaeon]|jgi:hypothetical protein|nr:hypothetical protein [Candidatus Woesearchaeota archaeon]
MTFKELNELKEKNIKFLTILNEFSSEVEKTLRIEIKTKVEKKLFGSGRPCYFLKKKGETEKDLFHLRNVITNSRQPSPIFMKIYSEKYEQPILDALLQRKKQIEKSIGTKVVFIKENEI